MSTEGISREVCRVCDHPNRVRFSVSDAVWEAVVPEKLRAHTLCLNCFVRLADEKVVYWDRDIKFFPVSFATSLDGGEKHPRAPILDVLEKLNDRVGRAAEAAQQIAPPAKPDAADKPEDTSLREWRLLTLIKHPPRFSRAPWYVESRLTGKHPYIVASTGDLYGQNVVCGQETGGGAYFIGDENVCAANAHLIAAAPDLFWACAVLLELLLSMPQEPKMREVTVAIQALEKARNLLPGSGG